VITAGRQTSIWYLLLATEDGGNVSPKRRFIFNGLCDVMSQNVIIFITTAMRTSNLINMLNCSHEALSQYRYIHLASHVNFRCKYFHLKMVVRPKHVADNLNKIVNNY
jgi:hypothetical protein